MLYLFNIESQISIVFHTLYNIYKESKIVDIAIAKHIDVKKDFLINPKVICDNDVKKHIMIQKINNFDILIN